MAKALPKTLYAKMQKDGDLSYVSAAELATQLVEMGETVKIGTYKLVEISEAEGVVSTRRVSK